MRISLTLLLATLVCVGASAAGLQSKRQQKQQQMMQHATAWFQYVQEEQTNYTIKGFEKATGVKLSLKEKIMFSILARQKPQIPQSEVDTVKANRLGTWSMVLGIAGIVLLFVPYVAILSLALLPAAIILGILGWTKANQSSDPKAAGLTKSVIGTVLGSVGILLALIAVIVVLSWW